jgi:hypothetical protein
MDRRPIFNKRSALKGGRQGASNGRAWGKQGTWLILGVAFDGSHPRAPENSSACCINNAGVSVLSGTELNI